MSERDSMQSSDMSSVRMDGVVSGDASNITGWSNTARVTALVAFSE